MTVVAEMSGTVEAVRIEAIRLADFLTGMDPNDWSQGSACPEWEVGDVVAHLTQGANAWVDFIGRALERDPGPPPGHQSLQPGDRGSEVTAQRAIEMRQSQGKQELLSSFSNSYDQLYRQLLQLKPEDWELPCFHRRGQSTIHEMVARRVQELAIHGWDIRSVFDPAHQLSDTAVPVVVGLAHRWLNSTFIPSAHANVPARYRFDISGPAPVLEDVVVYQNRFEVEATSNSPAEVTFSGSGNDYLLVIYGRLSITGARDTGNLKIDGPLEQAALFNTWFRGV